MNIEIIIGWWLIVLISLIDIYFRFKFNRFYLSISIPIYRKSLDKYLRKIGKDNIFLVNETKILFSTKDNCIWLQCKLRNRSSTLGLIKKWLIDIDNNDKIVSEEVRLSFGALMVLVIFVLVYFNQIYQIIHKGYSGSILNSMYILVILAFLINYWFAFIRLKKESAKSMAEFTK
jgi:hypothetical protein